MLDPLHHEQRSIPELFTQLVDEGKTFARAEVALYKAKASLAAKRSTRAAIFAGAALVIAIGAVGALLVGLILALATLVGPLLATILVVLSALIVTGVLGYLAYRGFSTAFTPEQAP